MLQQIANLVEFDLKRFDINQVLEDFNHKFTGSILKIDGVYHKLIQAGKSGGQSPFLIARNLTKVKDNTITQAKSIEKVTPKTGLYASEFGLLYLHRLPNRQWIKSLAINKNYAYKNLAGDPTILNTALNENSSYNKETIIYKDKVFLHWKCVGKVKNGDTIHVTNKNFFEEIKELWNQQYQIILDADPRQQKAEKLMLDF